MFIIVRQTICGAMLIRVGKLQFIGLIGGADPNLGATRSPKWPINCSLPTRINIDPNLQFIKPSLPTRCVMEPYTSIQYLFSFILWRKCV